MGLEPAEHALSLALNSDVSIDSKYSDPILFIKNFRKPNISIPRVKIPTEL
jgi:hypothetical protein